MLTRSPPPSRSWSRNTSVAVIAPSRLVSIIGDRRLAVGRQLLGEAVDLVLASRQQARLLNPGGPPSLKTRDRCPKTRVWPGVALWLPQLPHLPRCPASRRTRSSSE